MADQEWRRRVDRTLDEHFERLEAGEERMKRFESDLATNTRLTGETKANTDELLTIFRAFQGAVKVGGWIGDLIKWVVAVLIAAGIAYWAWKTGELPRKP